MLPSTLGTRPAPCRVGGLFLTPGLQTSRRVYRRDGIRVCAGAAPPEPPRDDLPETPPEVSEGLQLPSEVISRIRSTVFGFDTFFVTSVEDYEADGVLFKGNLRGADPAMSYAKMRERLRTEVGGDQYELFLLEDQEEKPVCVVLPKAAVELDPPRGAEAAVAALFGAASLATIGSSNGVPLLRGLLGETEGFDAVTLSGALPGVAAVVAILAAHEIGHAVVAKQRGVQLSVPFFIPAGLGLIGSFGAITRIRGLVPDRDTMLRVASAGPLVGTLASAAAVAAGLGLTAAGIGADVDVQSAAFNDSLLMGNVGHLLLPQLSTSVVVQLNPLLLAGWAGLISNALNCLPVGELDGGRMVLGLYGRRAASRVSVVTLFLLGVLSIPNTLFLYWFAVVIFLQRGPIVPCREEISLPAPDDPRARNIATALTFVLPLIVLLPYFGDVSATQPIL